MSQGNLCRLCVNICEDHKCIYDEIGHGNESYHLIMKYFDPAFLNMNDSALLTVMCLECWRQISDFYNYQQSVYKAQLKLNDMDQKPEIKSENELVPYDVNKYPTHSVVLVSDQEDYIKAEDNLSEQVSSYAFGSNHCYVIAKQEEERLPESNQDFVEVNVKPDDGPLPDENHGTLLRERQISDFGVQTKDEPALAMPKLEIIDVFSGEDDSQEAMSDESESGAGAEFNDSADGLFLSANRKITNLFPRKDALTKTKFIEDSDDFIKQWQPSLTCSLCIQKSSTYSLLRQHFLDKHPLEKCYILCCQRKFYQRNVIEDHIRHHIDPNAFKCELCDKRHTTRRQLADHVRNHHSKSSHGTKNTSKRKVSTDQEINDLIAQWKSILECALCSEGCSTLKQLQLHFRQNHPHSQFYIECCYRKLKKRYDIEDHARSHTNPVTFTCEQCSCTFSSQSYLLRHIRCQHSKLTNEEVKASYKKRTTDEELEDLVAQWKPNLECVVCRITCPTLKMLQLHFRQNHPIKQFYIECCHRKFKRRYDIEFHARNHVDPITFMCEVCTTRFSTQSNLVRHMRVFHSNPNNDVVSNSKETSDKKLADIVTL